MHRKHYGYEAGIICVKNLNCTSGILYDYSSGRVNIYHKNFLFGDIKGYCIVLYFTLSRTT